MEAVKGRRRSTSAPRMLARPVENFYVVVAWSNPQRYTSRGRLHRDFVAHMHDLRAQLMIVELAFGDRPFEVTQAGNELHLQLRTDQVLWFKENLINVGISHLRRVRPRAEMVAWVDGDIQFSRRDIVAETVQQLQHYRVVQMFSHAVDLGPKWQSIRSHESFMYRYRSSLFSSATTDRPDLSGHPGFAWATWISNVNQLPLFDQSILGSGDTIMARGLVGQAATSIPEGVSPSFRTAVLNWGRLAEFFIRRNVGYVDGSITHAWHGDKSNRKYAERWDILTKWQLDPATDLTRDLQGLYRLNDLDDRAIALRDDIRDYFKQRDEDSTFMQLETRR